MNIKPPLFSLGQVVATPGALQMLHEAGLHPLEFISRHVAGNFGELCDDDKEANRSAIAHGGRVLSSYKVGRAEQEAGWKLWVISEGRNAKGEAYQYTTLLLPEEY
jgi:hypothetical protein